MGEEGEEGEGADAPMGEEGEEGGSGADGGALFSAPSIADAPHGMVRAIGATSVSGGMTSAPVPIPWPYPVESML